MGIPFLCTSYILNSKIYHEPYLALYRANSNTSNTLQSFSSEVLIQSTTVALEVPNFYFVVRKYIQSTDTNIKNTDNWSEQSVCAALGCCRQNVVATINRIFSYLFWYVYYSPRNGSETLYLTSDGLRKLFGCDFADIEVGQ